MKKTYLIFKVRYAPKVQARHTRFGSAAFRSDANDDDDDDDEDDKREALLKKINSTIEKKLGTRAKQEDVEAIQSQLSFLTKTKDDKGKDIESPFPIDALRAMADDKTGVMAKLIEQGLEIQQLKTEGAARGKDMSVRGQVEAWQKKHKDQLQKVINKSSRDIPEFELDLRVADYPMHVSTVNSGNSPFIGRVQVESGINDFLRYPNVFWNFLRKGRTNAPTYVWVNKSNPQGAAAFIGPGVLKPPISFELVAETSVAKKIADSAKAGTELLQDIDGMTSFIEDELRAQVFIKLNTQLMSGTGSSTAPQGIQGLSEDFAFYTAAAANIKTANPNYMDAIRAAVAALRSGVLTGKITVFVNSIDLANMDLSKAQDSGVYLLPPFITANGTFIAGAQVVEDNNVPVGHFQAGFLDYYRILIYKDFVASWGWENDDFTRNLVTAVGEMRLHQFFNSIYTGAFMYDTFANVISAIDAA